MITFCVVLVAPSSVVDTEYEVEDMCVKRLMALV